MDRWGSRCSMHVYCTLKIAGTSELLSCTRSPPPVCDTNFLDFLAAKQPANRATPVTL